MKALLYSAYGGPDRLSIKEKPKPAPAENEVLVEVHAVSLNSWDYDLLRGKPFVTRMVGPFRPTYSCLGADIAGVVSELGSEVTDWKVGDRVFGDLSGDDWSGLAEYTTAKPSSLARIPSEMDFLTAASLPQAGVMAVQGIVDYGQVEAGMRVAINGAGGGVGTLALQLAKNRGAEVTAIDHRTKLDALGKLGADATVDYRQRDFTEQEGAYDLILDMVARRSLKKYRRALAAGGRFVLVGGKATTILQTLLSGRRQDAEGRHLQLLMHAPNQGLAELGQQVSEGALRPIIDRVFPLEEGVDAFRYFGENQFVGKVMVQVKE